MAATKSEIDVDVDTDTDVNIDFVVDFCNVQLIHLASFFRVRVELQLLRQKHFHFNRRRQKTLAAGKKHIAVSEVSSK